MAKEKKDSLSIGLGSIINEINDAFGKNSISRIKDMTDAKIERRSTGSIELDVATGGGYPKGGIVLIHGPESSGKTTLTILAMKQAQKENPDANIAFIDGEHAFDFEYAEIQGVNTDKIILAQPNNLEEAATIVRKLVGSKEMDLIIFDSIAATKPKEIIEGDISDHNVGLHAKMNGKMFLQCDGLSVKNEVTMLFINQTRTKIGVSFGDPTVLPGGDAQRFHARQILAVSRGTIDKDKEGNSEYANTGVRVAKNKLSRPHLKATLKMRLGFGFSIEDEILDYGVAQELIEKAGNWFSYNGTKIGQGRPTATQFLRDNKELAEELENKIRKNLGLV